MDREKLAQLPIIDWEEGIRLAGHKKELARDILNMLVRDLPHEVSSMQKLHQEQNFQELLKSVHKLHGAVCYTGTPRLKTLLATLETRLKTHIMNDSSLLLDQLDTEVNHLLKHLSEQEKELNS
jgi:two-component system sensor histidine kinase BarA